MPAYSPSLECLPNPPIYTGNAFVLALADFSLISTSVDDNAFISCPSTGEIREKLLGDNSDITGTILTPDGRFVAVFLAAPRLAVHDLSNHTQNAVRLASPVHAACADSTLTLVAYGGTDGIVNVFDVTRNVVTHTLRGHAAVVSSVCFYAHAGGRDWLLALGDATGVVKIWDLVTRKCVATLSDHTSVVRGVAFSSDLGLFVSGARDSMINIYTVKSVGKKRLALQLHRDIPTVQLVESCGFLSGVGGEKEEYVYFAGDQGHVQVYDFEQRQRVAESPRVPEDCGGIIQAVVLSDSRLFGVYADQMIHFWDLSHAARGPDNLYTLDPQITLAGNHGVVAEARFAGPDLNMVAMATNASSLRILRPFQNRLAVEVLPGHTDLLSAIDSLSDGLWLATASKDGLARLWKYSEGSFVCIAAFFAGGALSGVVLLKVYLHGSTPKFLITAGADGTVKRWEVPTGLDSAEELPVEVRTSSYTRKGHEKDINGVDLAPNDEFFVTASYDKTAKIWSSKTGETVGILRGHRRGLWKAKFCPFEKIVVTCLGDATLKVWLLDTYQCLRTLEGHTNAVLDVVFVDGRHEEVAKRTPHRLVLASADNLLKIWDMKTGEIMKTLDGHEDKIWSIAAKNDGMWMVSADGEGYINIWQDNTAQAAEEAEVAATHLVEQQQSLENFIRQQNWSGAFELALKLDHPMRLYRVLSACMQQNEGTLGSEELEQKIAELEDSELVGLLKKVRSWNVNFRFFEVAQRVLRCVFERVSVDRLVDMPGVGKLASEMVGYNVRHLGRVDGLVEESYIVDWIVDEF